MAWPMHIAFEWIWFFPTVGANLRSHPDAVFFPQNSDTQIERPYGKHNLLVWSSSQQSEGRASRAAQPEMGPPF